MESRLELEFETLYLRLFLPPVRGGSVGARKRYAGLARDGEEENVVFTGRQKGHPGATRGRVDRHIRTAATRTKVEVRLPVVMTFSLSAADFM